MLENQPAWRPHLHSKAALGGSPERLLKDLEWLGLLFESLVIRDLRVLVQVLDGEVFHYRDNDGVEAAAGLQRFRHQIDTRRTGDPVFLAVNCGSGYGYRRADGIAVLPVGALGP